MKKLKKKLLFRFIPVVTTICSLIYIGYALNQNGEVAIDMGANVKEIAKMIAKK